MEQVRNQVITNLNKASDIFESLYDTFDSKVDLLKNILKDKSYARTCSNSSKIYEAIQILGDNAAEETPRKLQQQYLAQLVKTMMSKPSYDDLYNFFKENNILFNAFCLMYIHFLDDATSEKEKQAHDFMTPSLMYCVEKITEK